MLSNSLATDLIVARLVFANLHQNDWYEILRLQKKMHGRASEKRKEQV